MSLNTNANRLKKQYHLTAKSKNFIVVTGRTARCSVLQNTYGRSTKEVGSIVEGTELKVKRVEFTDSTIRFWVRRTGEHRDVYLTAGGIDHIKDLKELNSIDSFKEQLTAVETDIETLGFKKESIQAKIDFLNEVGETIFDVNQFKSYQILKLMKENPEMGLAEQSKLVADIIA